MRERRAYRITGRVQGVGFRWFTTRAASALDLIGIVRNAPDGSVEVVAAGGPEALDRFESRLREGPPGARVEAVRAIEIPDVELPHRFEIGW